MKFTKEETRSNKEQIWETYLTIFPIPTMPKTAPQTL